MGHSFTKFHSLNIQIQRTELTLINYAQLYINVSFVCVFIFDVALKYKIWGLLN